MKGKLVLFLVDGTITRESALVAVFLVLLSAMAALSGSAAQPIVPISKLPLLDPGSKVTVKGLLVDLWERDDGAETLILLDPRADVTAKVFCSRGVRGQLSGWAHIGDLVMARGEVSSGSPPATIYAETDAVEVIQEAELVMSVTVLARSWSLFEGDRFEITGVLKFDPITGSPRLFDSSMGSSVELRYEGSLLRFAGTPVGLDGILRFDSDKMSLFVEVESISSSA